MTNNTTTAETKEKQKCRYFLKCTNEATTTIPNPILGDVPACKKCSDFYERMK